jgi:hypothetical protein
MVFGLTANRRHYTLEMKLHASNDIIKCVYFANAHSNSTWYTYYAKQ